MSIKSILKIACVSDQIFLTLQPSSSNSIYTDVLLRVFIRRLGFTPVPSVTVAHPHIFACFYNTLPRTMRVVETKCSIVHVLVFKRNTFEPSLVQMALDIPASSDYPQNENKIMDSKCIQHYSCYSDPLT